MLLLLVSCGSKVIPNLLFCFRDVFLFILFFVILPSLGCYLCLVIFVLVVYCVIKSTRDNFLSNFRPPPPPPPKFRTFTCKVFASIVWLIKEIDNYKMQFIIRLFEKKSSSYFVKSLVTQQIDRICRGKRGREKSIILPLSLFFIVITSSLFVVPPLTYNHDKVYGANYGHMSFLINHDILRFRIIIVF